MRCPSGSNPESGMQTDGGTTHTPRRRSRTGRTATAVPALVRASVRRLLLFVSISHDSERGVGRRSPARLGRCRNCDSHRSDQRVRCGTCGCLAVDVGAAMVDCRTPRLHDSALHARRESRRPGCIERIGQSCVQARGNSCRVHGRRGRSRAPTLTHEPMHRMRLRPDRQRLRHLPGMRIAYYPINLKPSDSPPVHPTYMHVTSSASDGAYLSRR